MEGDIEAIFVPPFSDHSNDVPEHLSGADVIFASAYVSLAIRFDSLLNEIMIKEALAVTLDQYPVLSGRYHTSEPFDFVSDYNVGAQFEVLTRPETDARSISTFSDWTKVGAFLLKDHSSGYRPGPQDPLLVVRLTLFPQSNVSVLGIMACHAIVDMASLSTFLLSWSRNCADDLPKAPLSRPQLLGQRRKLQLKTDKRPDIVHDLHPSGYYEVYSPLDGILLAKEMANLRMEMSTIRSMEFCIPLAEVDQWKLNVKHHLPPGGWVSRFELTQAMIFYANSIATGVHELDIYTTINARLRIPGHANYFGNLVSGALFKLKMSDESKIAEKSVLEIVSNLAWVLHGHMRNALKDTDTMTNGFKHLNAMQDLGFNSEMQFTLLIALTKGQASLINSWDFPLLDIQMGSGKAATKFIGPDAMPGYWKLMPRDQRSSEQTVHIALKHDQAERFLRSVSDAKLPFKLVEDYL